MPGIQGNENGAPIIMPVAVREFGRNRDVIAR